MRLAQMQAESHGEHSDAGSYDACWVGAANRGKPSFGVVCPIEPSPGSCLVSNDVPFDGKKYPEACGFILSAVSIPNPAASHSRTPPTHPASQTVAHWPSSAFPTHPVRGLSEAQTPP